MERILYGDNQFFAVNHISDVKSLEQSIKFKDNKVIMNTIDDAINSGINTFMCTTHDRISFVCETIRENPEKYKDFNIYPCMPYAHKYANAVTELGIQGTLKQYMPGNFFGSMFKGGKALVSQDYISIMELLIDSEMKMFKGVNTPVIFLQNVITDLLLGLGMDDVLKGFHDYVIKKYNSEPGFITMNLPKMVEKLESLGIENPIICTSINSANFRMSGGKEIYTETLKSKKFRGIAMQVLGGGAIHPKEALEYVCDLPNIQSILFGASSKRNIQNTVQIIRQFDNGKND
ncbi:hypothetical protein D1013_04390 [Euzebyella marina]|uniref:Uncharacterized protein n=1 Tax=Euzebyella marina TaxID=1761453 RepID=A0A3G2L360_9FLAO|nr:hypothetical protein [Euzebyella marina]AYN66675.1 hypothetical protein D1013_04390 [Euzebyella marina]